MLGVYGFLYYCIFGFRRPEPPPGFSLYAVLVNLPPSEPRCCIRRTTKDERSFSPSLSEKWLPREPDDDVMTQAYFDAKCAGDDGDFADLAYDNVYY